jgi:uncharacterized protein
MKSIFICCLSLFSLSAFAQPGHTETKAEQKAADKPKYEMKRYWFVMLTRGANRSQDSATAAQLQKGHMDNITRLHAMGKILVAGPFGDNGNWRGIFIMDCKDQKEAEELLQTDPMIKVGRLSYEIRPWWTAKNEVFK